MRLKNYQEDLVLHVIQVALEERPDIQADEDFIHNVAAYTLNRIPPKYIHTERGFTRMACSDLAETTDGDGMSELVQTLLVVNRAIDIVQSRRAFSREEDHGAPLPPHPQDMLPEVLAEMEYWHNLPCVLGQVLDARDDSPLYGVTVTAYLDDRPASPADPGWRNPCRTLPATKGYYSFLPRPVRSREESLQFTLALSFEHPRYQTLRLERQVRTRGDFEVRGAIGSDDIVKLDAARLAPLN